MQTIKVNDKTYNVTNVTDGDPHKKVLEDINKKSEESIKIFNEQLSDLNKKIKDKDTCEVEKLKFTATPLMLKDAENAYSKDELTSKENEGFDDTIKTRYPNIMKYYEGNDKLEERKLPNNDKNKKIIAEIEKIKAYKIAHPIFEEYLTKWRKAEEEKAAAQATAAQAAAVTETQAALEAQAAALAALEAQEADKKAAEKAKAKAAEKAAATAVAEKEAKAAAEAKAARERAAEEARVAREAIERAARERAAEANAAAERAAAKKAADEKAEDEARKQAAEKKASEQEEDAKAKAEEALLVENIAQLSEAANKKRAETNKKAKPKTNIYEQAAINARVLKPPFRGGSRKSKNYIKYKKEYLKLKEELNQLHK